MNKKNIEAIYPLSGSQQGMLFESLYAPDSGIYIEQFACKLQGKVNISAFHKAWQGIIERHPILRTAFVWKDQDEALQVVLRQVEVPIEQQNWRSLELSAQQQQLEAYLNSDRTRSFNLSKPPLMRVALLRTENDTYQFIWTRHHILMDGWCGPMIFNELLLLYQAFSKGEDIQLAKTCTYRDYINWLKKQDRSQAEAFWRQTLQGFTKPTPLGITVTSNHPANSSERYGKVEAEFSAAALQQLQSILKTHRLTLNTLVQGVWALLLSRYSNQEDILFGITVSGRPADLSGIESAIGLFINTLPLRVKITRQTLVWDWLQTIQTYNLEMRDYEYIPSGQVHQWSEVPGALPLYESILVFENYPVNSSGLETSDFNIDIQDVSTNGAQTHYALTLLAAADSELSFKLVYDARRFESVDTAKILEHLIALLTTLVNQPELKLGTLLDQIPATEIPQVKLLIEENPQQQQLIAARTPIEEVLVGIWTQILGIEQISTTDNFFELGGHSLLATQVMSRIRNSFKLELPLRCIFETSTIAGLAQQIETAMNQGQVVPPIVPVSRDGELPLSFAQERLWFIDQLDSNSALYNTPTTVLVKGELNIAALEQSLNEIVKRHESLRTNFKSIDGLPIQKIASTLTLSIPIIDLQHLPENERQIEALRLAAAEAESSFNLAQDPLLRVTLLRLAEQEHIVLFITHHIISDAWSMGVLVRELTTLYAAITRGDETIFLPPLPIQYADFAVWQRNWLQGEVLEEQLNYWKQQLGGKLPIIKFPEISPSKPLTNNSSASESFILSPRLSTAIASLSRQENATLFMTLLATLNVVLYRYTGADDIVIGTDVANRNRSEIEDLIGFFINILVLRTDLSSNPTFRELLHQVREKTLGAYAHQDLPFSKLVEALQPERKLSQTPLFQVLFVMQNAPVSPVELPGLTLELLEVENSVSRFDLVLFMQETEAGIIGTWKYNTSLFNSGTITKISKYFETLLGNIIAQPNAKINSLEIMTPEEKQQQVLEKTKRQSRNFQKFKKVKPEAVNFTPTQLVKTDYFQPEYTLPLVCQPNTYDLDFIDWAKNNRQFIETNLLKHGAILFRGFNTYSVPDFENFAEAVCPELFGEYGDLPREGNGGKVYGSTPYPADKAIFFHNESSHMHRYPMKIWFYCVHPSQERGETPTGLTQVSQESDGA